jgi:superfamily I DNA/RNA helicase
VSPEEFEEERRVAFVGITRAKRRLLLTWAQSRREYGHQVNRRRSRFLEDIRADETAA